MAYTKEQLLTNSSMSKTLARDGRKIKGVLTNHEQNQLAAAGRTFQVISDRNVFFFTDDYCMTVNILPDFVPSSTVCPHYVKMRPSLPDGCIRTAEDFIKIYEQDKRQITSMDELVTYLNTRH